MSAPTISHQTGLVITQELKEALHRNQTLDNGSAYVSERHINSGEIVRFWQEQLKLWALTQPDLVEKYKDMRITSSFQDNPIFTELIKNFQRRNGLDVDGIIGPRTFRAFATKYFFKLSSDGSVINLGQNGFEKELIPIIAFEEYLNVISQRRRSILSWYGVSATLPPGISAREILNDKQKLERFNQIYYDATGGKPPVPGEVLLSFCERYNYDPTLLLAQAIAESHCGTRGRAVFTKNIFNVGNTDNGQNRYFSSWEEGVVAYLELMKSSYGDTAEEVLASDFRRIDGGGRYATDPAYTQKIYNLVHKIRQHIDPKTTFDLASLRERYKDINNGTVTINGVTFQFSAPQDIPHINPVLLSEVARACVDCGINSVYVSCAITGHSQYTKSGNVSRHWPREVQLPSGEKFHIGYAIDLTRLNGLSVSSFEGRTLARQLVQRLQQSGYILNNEGGNPRAVLFECQDHYGHIHISNMMSPVQLAGQFLNRKVA
ncbi:MAG: glucosaminidase domain-containing protein [Deltaproteobacteria bacterium]|nr:glucosaminidase domain-containing protein [Deltaproteobacteria bacterium]